MKNKTKGLLPDWIQSGFLNLLNPLIVILTKLNINPNTFTVLGFIITAAGSILLIIDTELVRWAGALILLGGTCDTIDGKLARSSGRVTKFGALFDSAIDRYSEVFMFFGIASFYVLLDSFVMSVVSFIALGGSTMVSYVRARAESLGFDAKVGMMQRPERIVAIGLGALFYFPLFHISFLHVESYGVTLLDIAIWAVAIFANYTAIHRIIHVYKQDNNKRPKENK
jgi:CDP-diacylglycerol--glycerol-3-phosphate 3-phosphatidyltransferase